MIIIVRKVFLPILAILSVIWRCVHFLKIKCGKYEKMPLPVVCVGNITLGGSGKTPTVLLILKLFNDIGLEAHVVSRGYKGKLNRTTLVNSKEHTAYDVGDEPLMLSRISKVWVTRNKKSGIMAAYKSGAKIVILDDGFQNPSVFKDLSLLIIDTDFGFGNGHIFPLGSLRESLDFAMIRTDLLLCLGKYEPRKKFLKNTKIHSNILITEGQLKPKTYPSFLEKRKIIAFCGIAKPEKFFQTLTDLNLNVIEKIPFPDHFLYSKNDLENLKKRGKQENALLLTTEKDFVKIPENFQRDFYSLPVEVKLTNPNILRNELKKLVS